MNIVTRDLGGAYGSVPVLEHLNLEIRGGSVVTLLGSNGCGKSTLLKLLARLKKPASGSILLDNSPLESFPARELARRLAVLPQFHPVFEDLSVEELVSCGRFPHRTRSPFLSSRDRQVVTDALALTGIPHLRRRSLQSLSGGERQRAWIAMTLAQEPQILLLDEPTTYLDICCQFEILDLVRRMNRERGVTVIMALHDLNLAAACSDRMIMLKDRRICCDGTPEAVLTPPLLRQVFDIEAEVSRSASGTPFCVVTGSVRRPPAPFTRIG